MARYQGKHTAVPRRDRPARRRGIIVASVVTGLVLAFATPTIAAYFKLDNNITRIDVSRGLGERPTAATASAGGSSPLSILVMGSDTRQGIGTREYGSDTVEGGAHSDTNLLVHLSAKRDHALVVSIPRDSMTKAPKDCGDPGSTVRDGEIRQWNYNFNQGGPGCTIKTLEGLTGIFVDHFVVVDFRGFQDMVDALGGVEVCTAADIADPDAQFTLSAGRHTLDGKQALGYVRVRKTVSDGSDLQRIARQQAFLSSVVQKATDTGLLLRPDKLFGFLDAATRSMTTDPQLGASTMASIANSLRNIGADRIEFVTVPTEVYPADPDRVQWQASATRIWEAIKADRPLESRTVTKSATSTSAPSGQLTVRPDTIAVRIVNDTGVDGLAVQTGAALEVQGFRIAGYGNGTTGRADGVVVRYAKERREAARTVAAAFPASRLEVDPGAGDIVIVHLGAGAANPVEVPNRLGTDLLPPMPLTAASSTDGLQTRKADQDICN